MDVRDYQHWGPRCLGRYYRCRLCRTSLLRAGEQPDHSAAELTLLFSPWSRWAVLWQERLQLLQAGRAQLGLWSQAALFSLTAPERVQLRTLRLLDRPGGISWSDLLRQLARPERLSAYRPPARPAVLRGVTFAGAGAR